MENQNKTTGGIKFDSGKELVHLIPASAILGMARVFEFGGRKYGLDNFREGFNHSRGLNPVMRHILAILGGQELDTESGLPHRYHALCSLAIYDYMCINHPELNDLYELKKKELVK